MQHTSFSFSELFAKAAAAHQAGRLNEAEGLYRALLPFDPQNATVLNLLAMVCAQREQWEECDRLTGQVIALGPGAAVTYYYRALALTHLGRHDEALAAVDQAIALRPDDAETYYTRGIVLKRLQRCEEAVASYAAAIALHPGHAEAHNEYGQALAESGRYEEAIEHYDRVLACKPDYALALFNRGYALQKLARYAEALASYEAAVAVNPADADTCHNLSLLQLLLGKYEEGWRLYEWRWKTKNKGNLKAMCEPLWLGAEPLAGKTILLHGEQGLGDCIQFCRYVPMVAALGAKVILGVHAPLQGVMSTLPAAFELVTPGQPLAPRDFHCPLMSLPLAFATSLTTIPAAVPYLAADPRKSEAWQARLGAKTKPRIGIAWSGGAQHRDDHHRSLALAALEPLWKSGFEFHCLQKEIRPQDAPLLARQGCLRSHAQQLEDFTDTAALIAAMDLVIAVDTSVAHLAGAMGKPTWILLPFIPDFRWMLEREDTPWYPTARLYRQPRRNDWASVIARVARELETTAFAN